MSRDENSGRPLAEGEREIILAMIPHNKRLSATAAILGNAQVRDLDDGGMGSIRFIRPDERRRESALAHAQYLDADGVLVTIELTADQYGDLFELDFWKVNFGRLARYPRPQDLTMGGA